MVVLAGVLAAALALAQPATLVRDIQPGTGTSPNSAAQSRLFRSGNLLYFQSQRPGEGVVLWRTDGTAAGTFSIADLGTSAYPSIFSPMVDSNGTLFFTFGGSGPGRQLWKSDGSAAGTVILDQSSADITIYGLVDVAGTVFYLKSNGELWKSGGTPATTVLVRSGLSPYGITEMVSFQNNVYFDADDGVSGRELWRSDGTAIGTRMVRDINAGTPGSNPILLTPVGSTLFFVACEPTNGCQLWKTDGTDAGTRLVKAIAPNPQFMDKFVAFGGLLVFVVADSTTGYELWRSDGSDAGTFELRDIQPGSGSSDPTSVTAGPEAVYFGADDGVSGRELWKSDGTTAGTVQVADITPGPYGSSPISFVFLGSEAYFVTGFLGGFWKTDGAASGTVLVKGISTYSPVELNGSLYFLGTDESNRKAIWKSDGSTLGTNPFFALDDPPGSSPAHLVANGSNVIFSADDPPDDSQLWTSDGSSAGTTRLTTFEPYNGPTPISFDEMRSAGGRLFFPADGFLWAAPGTSAALEQLTPIAGYYYSAIDLSGSLIFFNCSAAIQCELRKSDGSTAGTQVLRDFGSDTGSMVATVGSTAYFQINGSAGNELWKTDGTAAGTSLVSAIPFPGVGSAVSYHGYLYFSTSEYAAPSIWRSDGTASGTESVIPLGGSEFTVVGDTLFFVANHPATGPEIWMTDGTFDGTHLVKDLRPGTDGSNPEQLVAFQGALYFVADDGSHGAELWRSDGTDGGTVRMTDIRPGPDQSAIRGLIVSGGRLFFSASDRATGSELWASDGTTGGTMILKDIYPGAGSSSPGSLVDAGGTLYFSALDPVSGRELWKSDGTAAGTVLVRDIENLALGSTPLLGVDSGGILYFSAHTDVAGTELWKSDGTTPGTTLVSDHLPGPSSSSPHPFISLGGRVLFDTTSTDGTRREIWSTDGSESGTVRLQDPSGTVPNYVYSAAIYQGRVFFGGSDPVNGGQLWVTDGTVAGTRVFSSFPPGSSQGVYSLVVAGPYLFFIGPPATLGPATVWRTDGTPGKTVALAVAGSTPLFRIGTRVYFAVNNGPVSEIWRTDGTAAGTELAVTTESWAIDPIASGPFLYFWQTTANEGELWRTDGTSVGTTRLRGGFLLAPNQFAPSTVDASGTLFFTANDGIHGLELWKSDGTDAGTVLVRDVWPGPEGSGAAGLLNVGGNLMFRANDGVHGSELWTSDGTAIGTVMLQDIRPGLASSRPGLATSANPVESSAIAGARVYFAATDSATGNELWSLPISAICTPPAAPAVASSKNPSCGDTVTLDAGPGYGSYLWSTGETTRTIQVRPSTTTAYTVYAANAKGCRASATFVQAVDPSLNPPAPTVSNSGPACVGDSIQLTAAAVAGGVYAWTGPNGFTSSARNPTIPAGPLAAAGLYSVTATVNGCTSSPATTTVVVHPVPFRPIAHNDGPHCAGQALQLSASTVPNATYSWTGPNGFTSSRQNPTIPSATPADSGVFTVTVAVDGCVSPPASTSVVVAACQQLPVSISVSGDAPGNGILEPGETVTLSPSWMNTTGSPVAVTGTATSFTGPAGATYSLLDATADYGAVAAGATASCAATGDCYAIGVSAPATRPLLHWDARFSESLSTGDAKTWSVHIGASFHDVPPTMPVYRFVETLLHNGVTAGCGAEGYCPGTSVTRQQMAVFLLVSQAGAGYVPPAATGLFADVPAASASAPWIEELARRGVTAGCGNGNFCPQADVTRAQMAVFLLVTREGSFYVPPVATGIFADVPVGSPFAPWIEELFHRGIAVGCGGGNYCPSASVSRGQMAVLLTTTFGLALGAP